MSASFWLNAPQIGFYTTCKKHFEPLIDGRVVKRAVYAESAEEARAQQARRHISYSRTRGTSAMVSTTAMQREKQLVQ